MKQIYSITVSGRVQGVFYRASAQKMAQQLNLIGFVQNQDDGSVYIEVQTNKSKLQQFVEWCKQGSRHAQVDHVDIKSIPDFSQDPGNSFQIY